MIGLALLGRRFVALAVDRGRGVVGAFFVVRMLAAHHRGQSLSERIGSLESHDPDKAGSVNTKNDEPEQKRERASGHSITAQRRQQKKTSVLGQ